jgi:hypothetical protein
MQHKTMIFQNMSKKGLEEQILFEKSSEAIDPMDKFVVSFAESH